MTARPRLRQRWLGRTSVRSILVVAAAVAAALAPTTAWAISTPAPAQAPTEATNIDLANSIIEWSAVVLGGFALLVTVLTLGIAIVGLFGFREIRTARQGLARTQQRVAKQLRATQKVAKRYEALIQQADTRVEEVVRSAYGYNQGQQAYNDGNYHRAADFFRRASLLQPTSISILYRLGRAYTNLEETKLAQEAFKKALDIDPDSSEAYRGLGLNARYENIADAMEYARRATEIDPTDVKNWNCVGLIHRDLGQLPEAIRAHTRADQLDGDRPITTFYLALLYSATNRPASAGEYILMSTRNLDQEEYYGRLKPLWAAVLRWALATFDNDEQNAAEWANKAAASCQSPRRTREVRGHMLFLLTALGRTKAIERLPDAIRLAEHRQQQEAESEAPGRERVSRVALSLSGESTSLRQEREQ